jgi:hypothetical protein
MASINQQGNYMVQYDLNRLQTNAGRMQRAMPSSTPLPEWAKSKLTQARSHVANVANYQQSKLGNTENVKFVSWEVLKLLGITMAAGIALSVPAALLTGDLKDKSKAEIETLRAKFRQQPIATGFWWAGGSSVLVGAKDNNPKQMALGAAMMAMGVNIRRVMVK